MIPGPNSVVPTAPAGDSTHRSASTEFVTLAIAVATGSLPPVSYPITVPNGGTGDTSLTAYAVLVGGTTATAAVQSIASVGAAGNVLTSNGANQLPTFNATTGTLVVGTPLVKNPYALSSSTTQAHGLGVAPIYVEWEWECLTPNIGYTTADTLRHSGYISAITLQVDTTNLTLIISNALLQFTNKTSFVSTAVTAADWKLTLTPYKLT